MSRPQSSAAKKPREPGTGVRQEQREQTRAAIIDSAVKVFAELGFDAAQTRTIAARAGVNHGLVHYYFSSKLKLWKACVDYLYDRAYNEGVLESDRYVPGQELQLMRTVIRRYVMFAVRHPEYARIILDEGRRQGPRLDWLIERHMRKHAEWLQELFRYLQIQGHMPRISPLVMQYMLWGMANTLFIMAPEVRSKVGIDPLKDEDLIAEQIRVIELLLLPGAPKSSSPRPRRRT